MAVQTTYPANLGPLYEGQDVYGDAETQSKQVAELAGIAFGRETFLSDVEGKLVRLPHSTQATWVNSGANPDFVTLNVISVDVVVNGVTTTVSVIFATSHLATITALAAAIDAVPGVASAVVGGASNRTITATAAADTDLYLTNDSVTLGATQPDVTLANTDAGLEYGPSAWEERQPDSNGVVKFEYLKTIGLYREAYAAMRSDAALNPGDVPYIRIIEGAGADQKRGMLTNAAGAGSDPTEAIASVNLTVAEPFAAGGLGVARINK